MITRSISKTTARITCADDYSKEMVFYGNAISTSKVRKAFLTEEPEREIASVKLETADIKVAMTEAEFVAHGKEIK